MQSREVSLEFFRNLVRNREPGAFSRWGDGEWHSVLGRTKGQNCDGHSYFPALGVDLRRVLESRPPYLLGLQPLAVRVMGDKIDKYVTRHRLQPLDWVNADVFHHASQDGSLAALVADLRDTRPVVVGPPHLTCLNKFLNYREFVTVPPKNAYLAWRETLRAVLAVTERLPAGTVVAVSAGMPAKLLVHQLFRRIGRKHLVIDFGSVWDVYAGKVSRRYMRDMPRPNIETR